MRKLLFLILCLSSFQYALASPVVAEEPAAKGRLAELLLQYDFLVKNCDSNCILNYLRTAPFLEELANYHGLPTSDVVLGFIAWNYEWGYRFQRTYGRPPTSFDWIYAYASNAESYREYLGVAPPLFAEDRWTTDHYFRLKYEYGGPY